MLLLRFYRPIHHLATPAGMEGEHPDWQPAAGLHRFSNGVGNVVKLEIEEDAEPKIGNLAHGVRAAGGEHFQPDLHPAHGSLQLAKGGGDFSRRGRVEYKDQFARHRWKSVGIDEEVTGGKQEAWNAKEKKDFRFLAFPAFLSRS